MEKETGNYYIFNIRTPTPVKQVINYEYGQKGEGYLKSTYDRFIDETMKRSKLVPKTTKTYEDKLSKLKEGKFPQVEKPLYKMRIFNNVPSKVKNIFKDNKQQKFNNNDIEDPNIDRMINQVQQEINQIN